jgi:hypothetical protein
LAPIVAAAKELWTKALGIGDPRLAIPVAAAGLTTNGVPASVAVAGDPVRPIIAPSWVAPEVVASVQS